MVKGHPTSCGLLGTVSYSQYIYMKIFVFKSFLFLVELCGLKKLSTMSSATMSSATMSSATMSSASSFLGVYSYNLSIIWTINNLKEYLIVNDVCICVVLLKIVYYDKYFNYVWYCHNLSYIEYPRTCASAGHQLYIISYKIMMSLLFFFHMCRCGELPPASLCVLCTGIAEA